MLDRGDIAALLSALRSGTTTPATIAEEVIEAIEASDRPEAWLFRVDETALRQRAAELQARGETSLPLYGIPFAVKDNIDVAGLPTTAGCPAFSYVADATAPCVQRLLDAGAMLVGKTHMDQFATGLVGTRSPHGPCRNAHVAEYISGGSSSGSAVVVAQRIVSFALGTDTAGSGRVPAVLNGIVGLKPTRGTVSTQGVVPACVSLDCVSVFATSCGCALGVLEVMAGGDRSAPAAAASFRFGVPDADALSSLDEPTHALFGAAASALERAGGTRVEIEYAPLRETAELLYSRGAWLAERDRAFGDFLRAHPAAVDPAVHAIVAGTAAITAEEIGASRERLAVLERRAAPLWQQADILVVPTVPRAWRIDEVTARPLEASPRIGLFNNFANLLGMSALAVPTGAWSCGVPFGVTLCAPAGRERLLARIGTSLQAQCAGAVPRLPQTGGILLAVVGAHLRGMPLHRQLTERRARFVAATRTSADYRLYALAATLPSKPGLRRVSGGGAAIEVEVWSLAPQAFASFVAAVPRPLAIGRLTLQDGSEVSGFVCEPEALDGAEDITRYGGWRAYVSRS